MGRWLVHEGAKGAVLVEHGDAIEWNAVVCYASILLKIARAEIGARKVRKLQRENDVTARVAMRLYRDQKYWVGDPVIEKLSGKKDAIREWLKKVGMEP